LQVLRHDRLRRDEHKGVLHEPPHVVARLVLGPLEGVRAQIEQGGHTQRYHRLSPDRETVRLLLHEHRLPLLVAQAGKVAFVGPVEEFAPLVGAATSEQIALV
jgi:hypothetical protein